ncbi:aconitase X [Pseudomonas aeruginosa]|nr:aconitase X [Pseudomonas aeruginosa]
MYHVIGVTPEALTGQRLRRPRTAADPARVGRERLRDAWHELDSADEARIDLVALGNPHFSASGFAQLAALCHGRADTEVALVITSSRQVVAQAEAAGHLATLRAFGARLVTDTCWWCSTNRWCRRARAP